MESRTRKVMVYIEPSIMDIVERLVQTKHASISGHIRQLLINDLRDRSLVTDRMLADMVSNDGN